jgi:hypothetical protein
MVDFFAPGTRDLHALLSLSSDFAADSGEVETASVTRPHKASTIVSSGDQCIAAGAHAFTTASSEAKA